MEWLALAAVVALLAVVAVALGWPMARPARREREQLTSYETWRGSPGIGWEGPASAKPPDPPEQVEPEDRI